MITFVMFRRLQAYRRNVLEGVGLVEAEIMTVLTRESLASMEGFRKVQSMSLEALIPRVYGSGCGIKAWCVRCHIKVPICLPTKSLMMSNHGPRRAIRGLCCVCGGKVYVFVSEEQYKNTSIRAEVLKE